MRSSKSRSRGKGNRNRSPSNNINRVFDSSGPEGKVRGTPQQVIDKYTQLSRDAFLANDRVAGENFQQHAEHYARLLSEAQRDADSKRQNQQNQQGQQGGNQNGNNGNTAGNEGGKPNGKSDRQDRDAQRRREKQANREQQENFDPGSAPQPDVYEPEAEADSGLVETPEEKPKKKRAPRKPKAEKAEQPEAEAVSGDDTDGAPEAAE
ncbi:DUF4167 domain-containing protein [Maritimibacter dapengensis]|uniref:DUF4167 domain-containing protein n=1 Tax=Maritimibacter dapengensis TaxID=2836868 RepID=A0ABS6T2S2_9RHOB|nr:DUF4167 domain-containing protein [Maritimibacter dapengensis]MBV7379527.1 DUF4167 domain-containing protein [Maritimibacter dapengensis]